MGDDDESGAKVSVSTVFGGTALTMKGLHELAVRCGAPDDLMKQAQRWSPLSNTLLLARAETSSQPLNRMAFYSAFAGNVLDSKALKVGSDLTRAAASGNNAGMLGHLLKAGNRLAPRKVLFVGMVAALGVDKVVGAAKAGNPWAQTLVKGAEEWATMATDGASSSVHGAVNVFDSITPTDADKVAHMMG